MFDCQHFPIFLLFLTCVEVRCDYYSDYDEPHTVHNPCNTEADVALEEIKSAVEDIKNLVVGLRQKVDPDCQLPPPDTGVCHPGFTYLPTSKSCYKVVYERHNWITAAQKCQELGPGSHLVAITSAEENKALKTFLATEPSKCAGSTACIQSGKPEWGNMFWTSGQHQIKSNCRSPYVWKISSNEELAFNFTNWTPGEPNCDNTKESCLDIEANKNFGWNDESCRVKICPLCEYTP